MAEFEDRTRRAEGAQSPGEPEGASRTPASAVKAAAAGAAEAVQGATSKTKDVMQDAATRSVRGAGEVAARGYQAASEVAERGRELVSRAPSLSEAIAAQPILSVGLAAVIGGMVGWTLRGAQDR